MENTKVWFRCDHQALAEGRTQAEVDALNIDCPKCRDTANRIKAKAAEKAAAAQTATNMVSTRKNEPRCEQCGARHVQLFQGFGQVCRRCYDGNGYGD